MVVQPCVRQRHRAAFNGEPSRLLTGGAAGKACWTSSRSVYPVGCPSCSALYYTDNMQAKRNAHMMALRHALAIAVWSFLLASVSSLAAQFGTERINIFAIGLALLLVVIVVGVIFDIVGVAATAAQEAPLNARAARRAYGATHAVWLVRNAHQVASVCNDVVGDVSGTLSGAIGVTLVLKLLEGRPTEGEILVGTTLMTASIAALVVGGKAYGKVIAIEKSTEIMFQVGRMLACIDRLLPFDLLPPLKSRRSRNIHSTGTPTARGR